MNQTFIEYYFKDEFLKKCGLYFERRQNPNKIYN